MEAATMRPYFARFLLVPGLFAVFWTDSARIPNRRSTLPGGQAPVPKAWKSGPRPRPRSVCHPDRGTEADQHHVNKKPPTAAR